MRRYAKPNQTIDDLKTALLKHSNDFDRDDFDEDEHEMYDYAIHYTLYKDSSQQIIDDLKKIDVDGENSGFLNEVDCGEDFPDFEMINGVPVAWCYMGGDWEFPVAVVLYIGEDGKLRAYIPKAGNTYNHKEKCAYGSEEDEEVDVDMMIENGEIYIDSNLIVDDVKNRISIR